MFHMLLKFTYSTFTFLSIITSIYTISSVFMDVSKVLQPYFILSNTFNSFSILVVFSNSKFLVNVSNFYQMSSKFCFSDLILSYFSSSIFLSKVSRPFFSTSKALSVLVTNLLWQSPYSYSISIYFSQILLQIPVSN